MSWQIWVGTSDIDIIRDMFYSFVFLAFCYLAVCFAVYGVCRLYEWLRDRIKHKHKLVVGWVVLDHNYSSANIVGYGHVEDKRDKDIKMEFIE